MGIIVKLFNTPSNQNFKSVIDSSEAFIAQSFRFHESSQLQNCLTTTKGNLPLPCQNTSTEMGSQPMPRKHGNRFPSRKATAPHNHNATMSQKVAGIGITEAMEALFA